MRSEHAAVHVRFIDHYVAPEHVPPSQMGRHFLAAAILCDDAGLKDTAHSYVEKAVAAGSSIQPDVNRLLPANPEAASP